MHLLDSPFSPSCIILAILSLSEQLIDHSFPNTADLYMLE